MIGFCPLASGSKGNCIYIGTSTTKLLIDAGLSASVIQKRLLEIGVEVKDLDAVLVTHEHSDHVKGIETLCSKYQIPIFCNSETAVSIQGMCKKKLRFKIFTTGEFFGFGDMEIHPFSVQHDAVDPVAFVIHVPGYKIGFCADLGVVTSLVLKKLEGCDFLYVESNHEISMVHACNRPDMYKQRVLSKQGHLSNQQCAELIDRIYHKGLKHVHLAHLSSECNNPELALKVISDMLISKDRELEVNIAYQDVNSKAIFFLERDLEPIVGHSDLASISAVF